jgi:integrase
MAETTKRRKTLWSIARIGDPRYPHFRLRITELNPDGMLYVVRMIDGKQRMSSLRCRRSELGSTPKEQEDAARAKALSIIEALAKGGATRSPLEPAEVITLATLAALYAAHGLHGRSPDYQKEQPAKVRRIAKFLGADRDVRSLCKSDVERYSAHRKGQGAGQGTVASDLAALKIALNWALDHRRNDGRSLLDANPLARVRIEQEKTPRRPIAGEDRYQALRAVAHTLSPALGLALDLVWATGRRIGAVLALKWKDVAFETIPTAPNGTIRWYAGRRTNNKVHEQVVPMNELARTALLGERAERPGTPAAFIFPAPKDSSKPLGYHVLKGWMEEAEQRAKVPHLKGGLFHPFRRGWATARKHYPLKDVAEAGGWRDIATLQNSYVQTDAQTILTVVNG